MDRPRGTRTDEFQSLFAFEAEPYRRSLLLLVLLPAAAALLVGSMPWPWHHHDIPAAGYTVIHGYQGANWLLAVAALLLAVTARLLTRPPGYYVLALLGLCTFATVLGMYGDYVDNQSRAAQLYVAAYVGPGFYVALAGMFVLIAALIQAWRQRI